MIGGRRQDTISLLRDHLQGENSVTTVLNDLKKQGLLLLEKSQYPSEQKTRLTQFLMDLVAGSTVDNYFRRVLPRNVCRRLVNPDLHAVLRRLRNKWILESVTKQLTAAGILTPPQAQRTVPEKFINKPCHWQINCT